MAFDLSSGYAVALLFPKGGRYFIMFSKIDAFAIYSVLFIERLYSILFDKNQYGNCSIVLLGTKIEKAI